MHTRPSELPWFNWIRRMISLTSFEKIVTVCLAQPFQSCYFSSQSHALKYILYVLYHHSLCISMSVSLFWLHFVCYLQLNHKTYGPTKMQMSIFMIFSQRKRCAPKWHPVASNCVCSPLQLFHFGRHIFCCFFVVGISVLFFCLFRCNWNWCNQ